MKCFIGVAQSVLRVLLSGDYLDPARKCAYFPMQNLEKISPRRSSAVNSPVIDDSAS